MGPGYSKLWQCVRGDGVNQRCEPVNFPSPHPAVRRFVARARTPSASVPVVLVLHSSPSPHPPPYQRHLHHSITLAVSQLAQPPAFAPPLAHSSLRLFLVDLRHHPLDCSSSLSLITSARGPKAGIESLSDHSGLHFPDTLSRMDFVSSLPCA